MGTRKEQNQSLGVIDRRIETGKKPSSNSHKVNHHEDKSLSKKFASNSCESMYMDI
jgi:hypothetical protein